MKLKGSEHKNVVIKVLNSTRQRSIDWTIKECVKVRLKVVVKRTLREFGYPSDMQLLATETVLIQAEMIVEELVEAA